MNRGRDSPASTWAAPRRGVIVVFIFPREYGARYRRRDVYRSLAIEI